MYVSYGKNKYACKAFLRLIYWLIGDTYSMKDIRNDLYNTVKYVSD
jgi:hypothetical protein